MKRAICFVAGLCALIVLTGCTSEAPAGEPASSGDIDLSSYTDVSAKLDYEQGTVALPTDELSNGSPSYVMRVLHAIAVKTDACMAEQGLPRIAGDIDWSPYPADEDRTLGRWSPTLASQYGIALAPELGPPQLDLVARGPEFNNAYSACNEEAKTALKSSLEFSQSAQIIAEIRGQAFSLTKKSDDGKAALKEWRKCAEDAGIVLDAEDTGPVYTYTERGKEAEIAAWVTYADCARSTGAIQEIANLRARYETALLAQKEAQVATFAKKRAKVIAELDKVIDG